jgi:hypothetical protein
MGRIGDLPQVIPLSVGELDVRDRDNGGSLVDQ